MRRVFATIQIDIIVDLNEGEEFQHFINNYLEYCFFETKDAPGFVISSALIDSKITDSK